MATILQINSSVFGEQGQSSQLAHFFVEQYLAKHPKTIVVKRDLNEDPIPHLNQEIMFGLGAPKEKQTAFQREMSELSDELIGELQQADVIVLSLPMYNFNIPSVLKSWIDFISRAGVTFRYIEDGPIGLLDDKPVYVMAARGGIYQGTSEDTQTDFVKQVLRFVGLTNVQFVYAEGLNINDEMKAKALKQAKQQISTLV